MPDLGHEDIDRYFDGVAYRSMSAVSLHLVGSLSKGGSDHAAATAFV